MKRKNILIVDEGTGFHLLDTGGLWSGDRWDAQAVDVHWAMAKWLEYFDTEWRQDYDYSIGKLESRIHDNNSTDDAYWNGSYAGFGEGMTAPDIVFHEFE